MSKLIQICASKNDLFGLDARGSVYHYNFATNDWLRLGRRRRDRGTTSGGTKASASPRGEDASTPSSSNGPSSAG
jgi:hypothetical protein